MQRVEIARRFNRDLLIRIAWWDVTQSRRDLHTFTKSFEEVFYLEISKTSSVTETFTSSVQQLRNSLPQSQHIEALKIKGLLDGYEHLDTTPTIGREYPTINLRQILEAPNADELIRDLAITSKLSTRTNLEINTDKTSVSERGVVFFRKQDELDNDLQKVLVQELGELAGKPATS